MQVTDEMVEELEKIAALITPGNFFHQYDVGDLFGWCERIRQRVRALSAALDVVVKPLKWENGQFSERLPRFTAHTMVGYYKVLEWSSGGFGGTMPPLERGCEPREFMADSLEEAKAAAQADYERRILSALSLSVVESEPVAWTYEWLWSSIPGNPGHWARVIQFERPEEADDIRNLRPLYAHPSRLQEKTGEE